MWLLACKAFLHPSLLGKKVLASLLLSPFSPALLPGFVCLLRACPTPGSSQGLTASGPHGVLSSSYLTEGITPAPPPPHFLLLELPLDLVQSPQHPWSGPLPPVQVPGHTQVGGVSEAGLGATMQQQGHAEGALG